MKLLFIVFQWGVNLASLLAAISVSDIHLSTKLPLARSIEKDWLKVQKDYLDQLYALLPNDVSVPIVFAGDLFDKWNQSPELINWCIDNLPEMYGVYGQHDLRNHSSEEINVSAFATMVKIGKVKLLSPVKPTIINEMVLWGFPWNSNVVPCVRIPFPEYLHIAVIHAYIWTQKTGYQGAPEEKRLGSWKSKLEGYDIAIFGDNHKGFLNSKKDPCVILNNGTFMRRKSDEINYKPTVGLIYKDGTVKRHYLDTSKDKFIEVEEKVKINGEEINLFVEELNLLGSKSVDFPDALKRSLETDNISEGVKKLVLKALEGDI